MANRRQNVVRRRDPERSRRLRLAIKHLLKTDSLESGDQVRLATYYRVSRQRVWQLVQEARDELMKEADSSPPGPTT